MASDRASGSVRINLTIPVELDAVLAELSALTGRGKATFASEALTWYLPRLRGLREAVKGSQEPGVARVGVGMPSSEPEAMVEACEGALGVKFSRDERRRLLREIRARGGRRGEPG